MGVKAPSPEIYEGFQNMQNAHTLQMHRQAGLVTYPACDAPVPFQIFSSISIIHFRYRTAAQESVIFTCSLRGLGHRSARPLKASQSHSSIEIQLRKTLVSCHKLQILCRATTLLLQLLHFKLRKPALLPHSSIFQLTAPAQNTTISLSANNFAKWANSVTKKLPPRVVASSIPQTSLCQAYRSARFRPSGHP